MHTYVCILEHHICIDIGTFVYIHIHIYVYMDI